MAHHTTPHLFMGDAERQRKNSTGAKERKKKRRSMHNAQMPSSYGLGGVGVHSTQYDGIYAEGDDGMRGVGEGGGGLKLG